MRLGCIADDLTGATDLALMLAREGMNTIQTTGAPDASLDLAGWLGDFDDDLSALGLADQTVFRRHHTTRTANWKLVMELFLEAYRVKSTNARTLARVLREDAVVDTSGSHLRIVRARKNLPEIANHARDQWDLRRYATVVYVLFPSTLLLLHADAISQVSLLPSSVDTVEFVHTMLVPTHVDEVGRAHHEATWRLLDEEVFGQEDLAMAESVQSGLHACTSWAFRLGSVEHPIRVFHDTLDRALAER